MEKNIDAENVYMEFSRKALKCKGNINTIVSLIGEYNGKILAMNDPITSFKFAKLINKLNVMSQEETEMIIRTHGNIVMKKGDDEYKRFFTLFLGNISSEKCDAVSPVKKIGSITKN